jgi:hypothetical protein
MEHELVIGRETACEAEAVKSIVPLERRGDSRAHAIEKDLGVVIAGELAGDGQQTGNAEV